MSRVVLCPQDGLRVPVSICEQNAATDGGPDVFNPCKECPVILGNPLETKKEEPKPMEVAPPACEVKETGSNIWIVGRCRICEKDGKILRKQQICGACKGKKIGGTGKQAVAVAHEERCVDEAAPAGQVPGFVFELLAKDQDLFNHVAARATKEFRSMEQQILWMLSESRFLGCIPAIHVTSKGIPAQ